MTIKDLQNMAAAGIAAEAVEEEILFNERIFSEGKTAKNWQALRERLEQQIDFYKAEEKRLADFMESIQDHEIKQMLQYYLFRRKPWRAVYRLIYGDIDLSNGNYCHKKVTRYLEKTANK